MMYGVIYILFQYEYWYAVCMASVLQRKKVSVVLYLIIAMLASFQIVWTIAKKYRPFIIHITDLL